MKRHRYIPPETSDAKINIVDDQIANRKLITEPISLNPSLIARTLGAIALLLVAISFTGQIVAHETGDNSWYGLIQLFYLDSEQNLPTGFKSLLLLCASVLLTVITVLERKGPGPSDWHWPLLSVGFLAMTADEAWSFHERLIEPVREMLGGDDLGVLHFAWVIPGILLVLSLAPIFWRFLLGLPKKTRLRFLIAACLYLEGAIIFALIGGHYASSHGTEAFGYSILVTVEESLEMAGMIVFIRALLIYIAEEYKIVRFRVREKR